MEEMKEKLSVAEEDAGEVKKWSGLSESEMDQSWKKLAGRMEEEVLDKYNVEESNKEVKNGRSASLGWRTVRKKQDIQNKKSGERIVGREFFLFREYNLQRLRSKQEESTEEEEKISL